MQAPIGEEPERDARESKDAAFMEAMLRQLLAFAVAPSDTALPHITQWYARAVVVLPERARAELVLQFAASCEARDLPPDILQFFLRADPAPLVISTATIALLGVLPPSASDALSGVRELVALARQCTDEGAAVRAAAILKGLVSVGDRRVLAIVGPCWRWLPQAARPELSAVGGQLVHAPLIEWLMDWMEETEGDEFGAVAGTLARMASTGAAEVLEVHRAIPVWEAAGGEVIRVQRSWTMDQFTAQIRPRLLQLAADEDAPRVMHDVLQSWGIDSNQRQMAGVFRRPEPLPKATTALGTLLDGTDGGSGLIPYQALQPADFLARGGRLLLSWSLFNPYGPTWSCLGLMPAEAPEIQVLFYRVLNPFQQFGGVVGVLRGGDAERAEVLGRLTEELLRRNAPVGSDASDVQMLGGGAPDLLVFHLDDRSFDEHVLRGLQASPRVQSFDLRQDLEDRKAAPRDPWGRASRQRQRGFEQINRAPARGAAHYRTDRRAAAPALITEWFTAVTEERSMIVELSCFPDAWHGAIDHASDENGRSAFTFWELESFLYRYGFAAFRVLAEVRGGAGMSTDKT